MRTIEFYVGIMVCPRELGNRIVMIEAIGLPHVHTHGIYGHGIGRGIRPG